MKTSDLSSGSKLQQTHLDRANEGFCEDLARQNIVAHLSQLQLGFWCCHIWVTSRHIWVTCRHMDHMLSHMGTCCHIRVRVVTYELRVVTHGGFQSSL